MAALVGLGFASGLPYVLAGDTLSAWLSGIGINIKQIGLFGLITLPYTFKFLWAPVMDRFTPPGLKWLGRRRGWLVLMQLVLTLTLAGIALMGPAHAGDSLRPLAMLGVMLVMLSASQDIVADAYRTDVLRTQELGAGAAVFVTGYRMAAIAGGSIALVLAKHWGWPIAFASMAALMALMAIPTLLAPEPEDSACAPQSFAEAVVQPVAQFISARGGYALVIVAFVLVFRLPDLLANRMTMPLLLQRLHFTSEEVGWIRQMLGFFITIIGAVIGGGFVAKIGLKKSLIVFGLLQALSNAGFYLLAVSQPSTMLLAAVIAVESFCGGLVSAGFVAFLMSCCDHRYSATQYALLTSLMALGGSLGGALTGFLVQHVGYATFFAITIAAGAPGMAMLPWLKTSSMMDEAEDESPEIEDDLHDAIAPHHRLRTQEQFAASAAD